MGNWFNRLMYAMKFQSSDLLLTNGVNTKSQILYDRTPEERVAKVAPYLTIDGNPYPAIVDGRVKWIVDGYTTSSDYPYSQQQQLGRHHGLADGGQRHGRAAGRVDQLHPQLRQGHRGRL